MMAPATPRFAWPARCTFPVLLLLTLGGVGCVPHSARNDARLVSVLTDNVARKGEQFAAFREALAKARQRNMDALERSALESEQGVQQVQSIWTIANLNAQAKAFQDLQVAMDVSSQQRAASAKLKEEQAKALDALHTGVRVRTDDLAATSKALARLAEEPDIQSQLKFLAAFGREVKKALDEAEKQAKAQADAGKDEADMKAKGAVASSVESEQLMKASELRKKIGELNP